MSSVVNGPWLSTFGIGRFHENREEIVPVTEAVLRFSLLNVSGWIPGLSIIAGIAHAVLGGYTVLNATDEDEAISGLVWLIRGVLEIGCVGFVVAPIDITVTVVRLTREFYTKQSAESSVEIPTQTD